MGINNNLPALIRSSAGSLHGNVSAIRHGNYRLNMLIRLAVIVSFIFMVIPVIDITVSGWFADRAGQFPLHENRFLLTLRDLHRTLPAIIVPALLACLILQGLFNRRWLPAPHKLLYILSVYAIGAAAIVHGLKYLVGRARPNEIMEFGGSSFFSPAWQIAKSCQSSCSFPSGESASAMAMLAIPLVLGGANRVLLLIITGFAALVFSLNRLVMGAHFLSDITLSWLFVAITMAWLWPVFQRYGDRIDSFIFKIGQRIRNRGFVWLAPVAMICSGQGLHQSIF
ncbi:phosphatase PAP2 family protein [Ochrobactrum sp. GRS2]|nr:phosphatase PAP2 family protein [Ochrobactrum sp. GRS2]